MIEYTFRRLEVVVRDFEAWFGRKGRSGRGVSIFHRRRSYPYKEYFYFVIGDDMMPVVASPLNRGYKVNGAKQL